MHHGVHRVALQQLRHGCAVAHLADDERRVERRLAKPPRQIIQDDDALSARGELQRHV